MKIFKKLFSFGLIFLVYAQSVFAMHPIHVERIRDVNSYPGCPVRVFSVTDLKAPPLYWSQKTAHKFLKDCGLDLYENLESSASQKAKEDPYEREENSCDVLNGVQWGEKIQEHMVFDFVQGLFGAQTFRKHTKELYYLQGVVTFKKKVHDPEKILGADIITPAWVEKNAQFVGFCDYGVHCDLPKSPILRESSLHKVPKTTRRTCNTFPWARMFLGDFSFGSGLPYPQPLTQFAIASSLLHPGLTLSPDFEEFSHENIFYLLEKDRYSFVNFNMDCDTRREFCSRNLEQAFFDIFTSPWNLEHGNLRFSVMRQLLQRLPLIKSLLETSLDDLAQASKKEEKRVSQGGNAQAQSSSRLSLTTTEPPPLYIHEFLKSAGFSKTENTQHLVHDPWENASVVYQKILKDFFNPEEITREKIDLLNAHFEHYCDVIRNVTFFSPNPFPKASSTVQFGTHMREWCYKILKNPDVNPAFSIPYTAYFGYDMNYAPPGERPLLWEFLRHKPDGVSLLVKYRANLMQKFQGKFLLEDAIETRDKRVFCAFLNMFAGENIEDVDLENVQGAVRWYADLEKAGHLDAEFQKAFEALCLKNSEFSWAMLMRDVHFCMWPESGALRKFEDYVRFLNIRNNPRLKSKAHKILLEKLENPGPLSEEELLIQAKTFFWDVRNLEDFYDIKMMEVFFHERSFGGENIKMGVEYARASMKAHAERYLKFVESSRALKGAQDVQSSEEEKAFSRRVATNSLFREAPDGKIFIDTLWGSAFIRVCRKDFMSSDVAERMLLSSVFKRNHHCGYVQRWGESFLVLPEGEGLKYSTLQVQEGQFLLHKRAEDSQGQDSGAARKEKDEDFSAQIMISPQSVAESFIGSLLLCPEEENLKDMVCFSKRGIFHLSLGYNTRSSFQLCPLKSTSFLFRNPQILASEIDEAVLTFLRENLNPETLMVDWMSRMFEGRSSALKLPFSRTQMCGVYLRLKLLGHVLENSHFPMTYEILLNRMSPERADDKWEILEPLEEEGPSLMREGGGFPEKEEAFVLPAVPSLQSVKEMLNVRENGSMFGDFEKFHSQEPKPDFGAPPFLQESDRGMQCLLWPGTCLPSLDGLRRVSSLILTGPWEGDLNVLKNAASLVSLTVSHPKGNSLRGNLTLSFGEGLREFKINDVGISGLIFEGRGVESVDVSRCENLTDLVLKTPALRYLNVSRTGIRNTVLRQILEGLPHLERAKTVERKGAFSNFKDYLPGTFGEDGVFIRRLKDAHIPPTCLQIPPREEVRREDLQGLLPTLSFLSMPAQVNWTGQLDFLNGTLLYYLDISGIGKSYFLMQTLRLDLRRLETFICEDSGFCEMDLHMPSLLFLSAEGSQNLRRLNLRAPHLRKLNISFTNMEDSEFFSLKESLPALKELESRGTRMTGSALRPYVLDVEESDFQKLLRRLESSSDLHDLSQGQGRLDLSLWNDPISRGRAVLKRTLIGPVYDLSRVGQIVKSVWEWARRPSTELQETGPVLKTVVTKVPMGSAVATTEYWFLPFCVAYPALWGIPPALWAIDGVLETLEKTHREIADAQALLGRILADYVRKEDKREACFKGLNLGLFGVKAFLENGGARDVTQLDLGENNLGDDAGRFLYEFFSQGPKRKIQIRLEGNDIGYGLLRKLQSLTESRDEEEMVKDDSSGAHEFSQGNADFFLSPGALHAPLSQGQHLSEEFQGASFQRGEPLAPGEELGSDKIFFGLHLSGGVGSLQRFLPYLRVLEDLLEKPIYQIFNWMGGDNDGALMALLLSVPSPQQRLNPFEPPPASAKDVEKILEQGSPRTSPPFDLKCFESLFSPEKNMEFVGHRFAGRSFKDTKVPVVIGVGKKEKVLVLRSQEQGDMSLIELGWMLQPVAPYGPHQIYVKSDPLMLANDIKRRFPGAVDHRVHILSLRMKNVRQERDMERMGGRIRSFDPESAQKRINVKDFCMDNAEDLESPLKISSKELQELEEWVREYKRTLGLS